MPATRDGMRLVFRTVVWRGKSTLARGGVARFVLIVCIQDLAVVGVVVVAAGKKYRTTSARA